MPGGLLTNPAVAAKIKAAANAAAIGGADSDIEEGLLDGGAALGEQQPPSAALQEAAEAIAESDEDGAASPSASRFRSATPGGAASQLSQEQQAVLDRIHPLFRLVDPAAPAAEDRSEFRQHSGFVGDGKAAGHSQLDAAAAAECQLEDSDCTQSNLGSSLRDAADVGEQTSLDPGRPGLCSNAQQEPHDAADTAVAAAEGADRQQEAAAADTPAAGSKGVLRLPPGPGSGRPSAKPAAGAKRPNHIRPRKVKQVGICQSFLWSGACARSASCWLAQ